MSSARHGNRVSTTVRLNRLLEPTGRIKRDLRPGQRRDDGTMTCKIKDVKRARDRCERSQSQQKRFRLSHRCTKQKGNKNSIILETRLYTGT
eukprot:scaffold66225_cov39-Attheya_sp.AAC.1